jgi:hypothetical protein
MAEYENEFGKMKRVESEHQISEESSPSEDSCISSVEQIDTSVKQEPINAIAKPAAWGKRHDIQSQHVVSTKLLLPTLPAMTLKHTLKLN